MNRFDEIMTSASPHVRDLAMRTRNLIREVLPDVVEVPWVQQRTIGYGVGPKKNSDFKAKHMGEVRGFLVQPASPCQTMIRIPYLDTNEGLLVRMLL